MFSTLTSHEQQVRVEFNAAVARWRAAVVVVDGVASLPVSGGDALLIFDLSLANRAFAAGFGVAWTIETLARRQLARIYGTGLVVAATTTTTEKGT